MVEEARDIRDRGYLAINLLLGGIAVAVGLFNMFVLHNFGPASMFDAFLGMSMITVGSLFIAPYMAPRQLGLPAPGVRMARRSYLPYPVPIPVEEGEEETPVPIPEVEEELPMLPSRTRRPSGVASRPAPAVAIETPPAAPRAPTRPRPVGLVRSEDAANSLAELEALGVGALASPTAQSGGPVGEPLLLPPYLPSEPPPADYLEETEPAPPTVPELEPQFKKALEDLAGAAGGETNGAHPLILVNGKPPETTLSILEEVLRQSPPFGDLTGGASPARGGTGPTNQSTVPEEAMSEVDHLERDLQGMPRVDEMRAARAVELPAPPSEPTAVTLPGPEAPIPVAAAELSTPGGRAGDADSALSGPPHASTLPVPLEIPEPAPELGTGTPERRSPEDSSPTGEPAEVSPAADAPLSAEQAMNVPESQLEEMARALNGMVTALHEVEPARTEVAIPAAPASPPEAPRPQEAPVAPESFSEDSEPDPNIDELERQLATMRSVLARDPAQPLPPSGSGSSAASAGRAVVPDSPLIAERPAAQPPTAQSTEEDLQRVLEEVQSAARMTQDRHTGREKKPRK